jgi:hypothetical protein
MCGCLRFQCRVVSALQTTDVRIISIMIFVAILDLAINMKVRSPNGGARSEPFLNGRLVIHRAIAGARCTCPHDLFSLC